MRAYTVATVAMALGVEAKWLDNVLSHHAVPGADRSVQGRSRRLGIRAVRVLAITRDLVRELSIDTGAAVALAAQLEGAGSDSVVRGHVGVSLDSHRLEADLASRLAYAVEVAPVPRRGRPPGRG